MEEDLLTALSFGFASVAMYAAILNIKKKPFSFFLWGICSLYVFYLDIHSANYLRAVLDVMFFITFIYGFIVWSKYMRKHRVLNFDPGVKQ